MEAIIIAAIRVLEREGLEQLSMTRIAAAAGLSVGSVYKYFPNREEIIGAIIDRQLGEMLVAFHSLVARLEGIGLEATIRGVTLGLTHAAGAHEKLHAPLYEALSPARRTAQHARALDVYVDLIALVLKLRGDVHVPDSWAAATLIVHVGDGVGRWLMANPEPASAQVMIDEAVRMVTSYLTPGSRT